MNFINPWGLTLLALVPLLILLYFLKLKRPEVRLASTLLWRKVIEDMRVNAPFQKLRRSLLLLLQLLLLLALIFALSRPILAGGEARDMSLIILIDTSASMSAKEADGKTRLELAKARVTQLIDQLGRNEEMMLISFNRQAEVVASFTSHKPRLRDALAKIRPTDAPTDSREVLALARSVAAARAQKRLLLLSDGAFPDPGKTDLPVKLEYECIGTPRPNLAITGLDLRRGLRDRQQLEMFVATRNFSTQSFGGTMNVYLDDKLLDAKPFKIEASQSLSQIFTASLPQGGILKVEFEAADALAADNVAWQVVPPPVPHKVLIVGTQTFFLERAFRAAPDLEATVIPANAYTPAQAAGCLAVIWNSVEHPQIAPTHNLYFGCVPPDAGATAGAVLKQPGLSDWDSAHPVTRFVDFSDLLVSQALTLTFNADAEVLLKGRASPLIGVLPHGDYRLVVVGFQPLQSNWPLLVSFPVFLRNCMAYFESQNGREARPNISVGESIAVSHPKQPPVVILPDSTRVALDPSPTGQYSFAGTTHTGLYHLDIGEATKQPIAVNLFDARESDLTPVPTLTLNGETNQAVPVAQPVKRDYGRYLLIAAALLLLGEWVVYHRRIFT